MKATPSQLNRRGFLKNILKWSRKLFVAGLLIFTTPWKRVMAGTAPVRESIAGLSGLSLRQWCQEKRHHHNGRFLNPFSPFEYRKFRRLLHWKLFSDNHFKAFYSEETVTPVTIDWTPVEAHQGCAVTFITHSCVMIKDVDRYLLVDPVFSDLFWFRNYSPLTGSIDRMPRPDHILITHGHYDHLDVKTLRQFDKNTSVISPLGYKGLFERLGMRRHTRLDWFESHADRKREIMLLPCNHWTMRNPLTGPNASLWGSYLIRGAGGVNIFVSGDLAWFDYFAEIGRVADIDLAIFNLGAYEPRWFMKESHLNPGETVRAFQALKARRLMIIHWGTFRLGDEPVHFPPRDIRREMEKQGLADRLVHLDHGQTHFFSRSL